MAASRYRNFMKLCEAWPLDTTKAGRDLGAVIRERVAKAFKHGETTNVNAQECDQMYESLHRINTNYYKNKYARSGESVTGAAGIPADQCRLAVSTEGLKFFQEAEAGLFSKLKGKMKS